MNELLDEKIENMIYEIRGKQVMLDSDLARLYQVETKRINEAVRRNLDKFPEKFSWQLTDEEMQSFLVAICDQKIETRGGRYKNPRVFTEQGVAMLATILKIKVAVQISIQIMDAFVVMKKYISTNLLEQKYINDMVIKHDYEINILRKVFNKLEGKNDELFFGGQIYDAYSLLLDIFNTSKNEIIIIDNYADKELLDVVSRTNRNVTIISKNMDDILIKKYQKQYSNLTIINNNTFHDRFIIIDKEKLYTCGSSFKDLGKKCFAITLIDDENILEMLLKNIYK